MTIAACFATFATHVAGAQVIWDFDDDNGLDPGIAPIMPASNVYQVIVEPDCVAFNPYPIMGAPSGTIPAWPRGFPLSLIKSPCEHQLEPMNDTSRVGVVQSLANHEPDVDGISRLTRIVPWYFDSRNKKTVVLPHGTLAPWNAQAALFFHPALWSMLLPVSVSPALTLVGLARGVDLAVFVGYGVCLSACHTFLAPHGWYGMQTRTCNLGACEQLPLPQSRSCLFGAADRLALQADVT
jgi:hypothetical protein